MSLENFWGSEVDSKRQNFSALSKANTRQDEKRKKRGRESEIEGLCTQPLFWCVRGSTQLSAYRTIAARAEAGMC